MMMKQNVMKQNVCKGLHLGIGEIGQISLNIFFSLQMTG